MKEPLTGKKTVGILGGMGPLATADLFRKLVLLTDAASDRDHIRVCIDSNVDIPDRTAAILDGGEDPVPEMVRSLRRLEQCGADCVIMPCNTAHYFLPRLQAMTELPFLSILTAAAEACRERFPGKTVGILGTTGTLSAGLYQNALDAAGVHWQTPVGKEQEALMRVIYDGVKAGRPAEAYRADFLTVLEGMLARGTEVFLLGCTELPPAAEALGIRCPTVDPTEELAKAAIRFCGRTVRT